MSKIKFDIYMYLDDYNEYVDTHNFDFQKYTCLDKMLERGFSKCCRARIRYDNMRCWIDFYGMANIMVDILDSIPYTFQGKEYVGWVDAIEEYNVCYTPYKKDKLIIYLKDGRSHNKEMSSEYGIELYEIPNLWHLPTKKGGKESRIPHTHKIVVVPKKEFYQVAYHKIIQVLEIHEKIGIKTGFYGMNERFEKGKQQLIDYGVLK